MSNIIDSIRLSGTTYQIQGGSITVDTELNSGSTNPVQNKVIYNKIDEVEEVTAAGLNALNDKISPTVELTQAQYDALVDKDPNTFYVITDAQAGDLTNYYTKSETNTLLGGKADTATTYTKTEVDNAITAATATKQDTLISGTNIKTINNESILGSGNIDIQGGGGSSYTAGRGISIANDVISVSLPISAGTVANSIAEGNGTTASGIYGSHAEGYYTRATGWGAHAEGNNTQASGNYSHAEGNQAAAIGNQSHAEGFGTIAINLVEHASGQYNVSSKANNTFGNSGNTLFSVGNGTAENARHNAFEIRQNGDIYLSSGGTDIKLQDHLGGGSVTVDTALDSGSTNPVQNRVIYNKIDEVEQVTAAGLNALNDKFDGLKLMKISQTDYDNLQVKDQNVLYIIVN